jgi:hypothetical protein
MRKHSALVVGGIIAAVVTVFLVPRPSRPDIVLNVSQVEAFQASQPDGQALDLWLVTIEATNLTSSYLFFSREIAMVQVRPGGAWAKPGTAGTLGSVPPEGKGDFALTVPPNSHACRFVFERTLGVGDRMEQLLRSSRLLVKASVWMADHLPRRRFAVEVPLPQAPTWVSPKVDLTHNPVERMAASGRLPRFRPLWAATAHFFR